MLWHRRLGHLSFGYLRKLKPNLLSNVTDSDFKCGICELAKNTKISYGSSDNKTFVPFMKIHSDVWGPALIPTPDGAKYFVTFIEESTRMVWVPLLKHKGEVFNAFEELYNTIKTVYRREVQILQSNNGGGYINNQMKNLCKANLIHHQTSCARSP